MQWSYVKMFIIQDTCHKQLLNFNTATMIFCQFQGRDIFKRHTKMCSILPTALKIIFQQRNTNWQNETCICQYQLISYGIAIQVYVWFNFKTLEILSNQVTTYFKISFPRFYFHDFCKFKCWVSFVDESGYLSECCISENGSLSDCCIITEDV